MKIKNIIFVYHMASLPNRDRLLVNHNNQLPPKGANVKVVCLGTRSASPVIAMAWNLYKSAAELIQFAIFCANCG